MTTLGLITLDRIIAALPAPVVTALQHHKCYLGGGFIRAVVADEKPSDIDLFIPSQEVAEAVALFFVLTHGCEEYRSSNSITLRGLSKPVQIITRWTYGDPVSLVQSFDFTLSQVCLWHDAEWGWCSTAADTFEGDVINRRLVYTAPVRIEEKAGSLFRLFKFYKRGYSVSLETLAAVVARASSPEGGEIIEANNAELMLTRLKQAGRYLPKPPNPPDTSEEPELEAGTGPGIGGSSSC